MSTALTRRLMFVACLAAPLPLLAQTVSDRPWSVSLTQDITYETNALSRAKQFESSDTTSTTSLGGALNIALGRQRVFANGTLFHSRFIERNDLNDNGYNLSGGINWETVGNLSGSMLATAGRNQADFNSIISNVTLKNVSRYEELSARAQLGMVSLLGLEASLGHRRVDFSAAEYASREYRQNSASAGLLYRPSGSLSLGLGLSGQQTDYEVPAIGQTVPDSSTRRDAYVSANWVATGASTLNARINAGKTEYDRATASDFSGATGSLVWLWKPTGRTSLTTTLARDSGQESGFLRIGEGPRARINPTDFSRITNSVGVSANYDLTGKIQLTGGLVYEKRDLVEGFSGASGKDETATATLGARWAATRSIAAGCKMSYEKRGSSGFGSFGYSGSSVGCFGTVTLD